MRRDELEELYYITLIANMKSIMRQGILSHNRVKKLTHQSIAMPEIQEKRERVVVPGGRKLHHYVNLYICVRNPMLYKRADLHRVICILSVSTDVLDLNGVVITDGNAGSEYVRFAASPQGLSIVNRERTFAEYWTDPDYIEGCRKRVAKCAEVLVPDRVDAKFMNMIYVSCEEAHAEIEEMDLGVAVEIDRYMFFR